MSAWDEAVRSRRRSRLLAGWQPTSGLQQRSLGLGSIQRPYWLAKPPKPRAPLLLAIHGLGMTGKGMAAFTGLAQRGPAAGFATVFPDGWNKVWDGGGRLRDRDGIDDPGFIRALVGRLIDEGIARDGALFLVGMSNGALFVEHLARHGLVPVTGIVLVAGTTTTASRATAPHPAQRASVLCFEGTADPTMPYGGGAIGGRGLIGWITARQAKRRGESGDGRVAVAAELVAKDWADTNGLPAGASVEEVPRKRRELPVTKLQWSAPGCPPVVLDRIDGGGHGWPGGPQYMPARPIGPIARDLDATGILLDMATREVGSTGPPS